jgi:very-short-patch-repair endonuclease
MNKSSRGQASTAIVGAAREQRRQPTPAEEQLWGCLKNRQLGGLKFRRQHPYERFVLDFFCVQHRMCVEVDGGVHLDPDQARVDAERQAFLESEGIRVLRFTNHEIETSRDRVLMRIRDAAERAMGIRQEREDS